MKKRFWGAMAALWITGFAVAQETAITVNQLPASVKQSVAKYFGKRHINMIVKDVDFPKTTYDIYFDDQTKAEFRSNGELKDAENYNGLPSTVVPAKIREYVKRHYPNTVITKWDKSRTKQEIELSNGLDLDFDLRGNFLRVDD